MFPRSKAATMTMQPLQPCIQTNWRSEVNPASNPGARCLDESGKEQDDCEFSFANLSSWRAAAAEILRRGAQCEGTRGNLRRSREELSQSLPSSPSASSPRRIIVHCCVRIGRFLSVLPTVEDDCPSRSFLLAKMQRQIQKEKSKKWQSTMISNKTR